MTKFQVRQLLLVLCAKRISFTLRREGSLYIVGFPQGEIRNVTQAIGA